METHKTPVGEVGENNATESRLDKIRKQVELEGYNLDTKEGRERVAELDLIEYNKEEAEQEKKFEEGFRKKFEGVVFSLMNEIFKGLEDDPHDYEAAMVLDAGKKPIVSKDKIIIYPIKESGKVVGISVGIPTLSVYHGGNSRCYREFDYYHINFKNPVLKKDILNEEVTPDPVFDASRAKSQRFGQDIGPWSKSPGEYWEAFESEEKEPPSNYEDEDVLVNGKKIDLRNLPEDLNGEERNELEKQVRLMLKKAEGFPQWLDLETSYDKLIIRSVKNGIYFSGPAVWEHQEEGEQPGINLSFGEWWDGGEKLGRILEGNY